MVLPDTPTTPTAATASPDSDNNDTPLNPQPISRFSYLNAVNSKNHHFNQPPPFAPVTHRECLKNFAASLGGHVFDGCGEFLTPPSATKDDPSSFLCGACGCHRSFHRRELDERSNSPFKPVITPHYVEIRNPPRRATSSPSPPPPPPPARAPSQRPPPTIQPIPPAANMLLSLSTSAAQDDQQVPNNQSTIATAVATPVTPRAAKSGEGTLTGRKRFRTRFTLDQKAQMHSFAETMGWKMQKVSHEVVDSFCSEIGVPRGVLKVWMHNNKNTYGTKTDTAVTVAVAVAVPANANAGNDGGGVNPPENGHNMNTTTNTNNSYNEENKNNNNGTEDHNNGSIIANGSSPPS